MEPCAGEPWPVERDYHAACCLGYAGDHIHLLATGGVDGKGKVLSDTWLFNLSLRKWKEVSILVNVVHTRNGNILHVLGMVSYQEYCTAKNFC